MHSLLLIEQENLPTGFVCVAMTFFQLHPRHHEWHHAESDKNFFLKQVRPYDVAAQVAAVSWNLFVTLCSSFPTALRSFAPVVIPCLQQLVHLIQPDLYLVHHID